MSKGIFEHKDLSELHQTQPHAKFSGIPVSFKMNYCSYKWKLTSTLEISLPSLSKCKEPLASPLSYLDLTSKMTYPFQHKLKQETKKGPWFLIYRTLLKYSNGIGLVSLRTKQTFWVINGPATVPGIRDPAHLWSQSTVISWLWGNSNQIT